VTIPLAWLAERHQAVLVTLRSDGSAQTSNIGYAVLDGVAKVSVTEGRAKTHNLRRDPRAVLHVIGDTFWQYWSVRATAQLSPVSAEPGDAVGRELLRLYEAISGPHPDDEEFLQAMVDEHRLVLTLVLESAVGFGVEQRS
jgi:PPOX class probable F420-dependent enzyme